MDIANKTIWQVSAGDTNRNYADLCLDRDVILNGPGSVGPWPECQKTLREVWKISERKLTDLRRFSEEIKGGDIVVLRLGTSQVYGVGIIHGEYDHHQEFGDVDGWDLEHIRRVVWQWKYNGAPKTFPSYAMKLGDPIQRLNSQEVKEWLRTLEDEKNQKNEPKPSPPSSRDIKPEEISEYLLDRGISNIAIQNLSNQIDELIRIARWYQGYGNPSEAETVTYLVVPLLRALGWTPQKMAIEWNRVDVALFHKLPREPQNLTVVVEAKPKGSSCLTAKSQAQAYAENPNYSDCRRLIVTDGLRYGVYLKSGEKFPPNPVAYLNLTRMREGYPIWDCAGANDAFYYMSSDLDSSVTLP